MHLKTTQVAAIGLSMLACDPSISGAPPPPIMTQTPPASQRPADPQTPYAALSTAEYPGADGQSWDAVPAGTALSGSSKAWLSGTIPWTLHPVDFNVDPSITADLDPSALTANGAWTGLSNCNLASNALPTGSRYFWNYKSSVVESPATARDRACTDLGETLRAMRAWEAQLPGLEFTYVTSPPAGDYFELRANGVSDSCSWNQTRAFTSGGFRVEDAVGKQPGKNVLRLKYDGDCGQSGIMHELGHALGLWHTQGRQDRNDWLDYDSLRVTPGWATQNIRPSGFADVGPFDFRSRMLYESYQGNGTKTFKNTGPGSASWDGATTITLDVSDLYQGVVYQDEFFEDDEFKVTVAIRQSSSCFSDTPAPFVATVNTDLEAVVTFSDLSVITSPGAAILNDYSCYDIEREGPAGEPDFHKAWRDPATHSDATYKVHDGGRLGPGDVSAVLHRHRSVLDGGWPIDASDDFGSALTTGDFDGDGLMDIAIGASGDDGGIGSVFVFKGVYGDNDSGYVEHIPWMRLDGYEVWALASANLDSDTRGVDELGIDELIIGHRGYGAPASNTGQVTILGTTRFAQQQTGYLQRRVDVSLSQGVASGGAPTHWPSGNGQDEFGRALAVGDADGDGLLDLAVGAPGADMTHFDPAIHMPLPSGTSVPSNWPAYNDETGSVFILLGDGSNDYVSSSGPVLDPYVHETPSGSSIVLKGSHHGSRYGAAVHFAEDSFAAADFLVVGAPQAYRRLNYGTSISPDFETEGDHLTSGPPVRTGAIWTYSWDGSQYRYEARHTADEPDSEFGSALASGGGWLWVGAPASRVGSQSARSGAAYKYLITEATQTESAPGFYTAPSGKIGVNDFPGTCGPMDGDAFGATLTHGDLDPGPYLAVGAPGRNTTCSSTVSGGGGEGGAYLWPHDPSGIRINLENSLAGAMLGDRFGSALSFLPRGHYSLAAGTGMATTAADYPNGQLEVFVGAPNAIDDLVTAGVVFGAEFDGVSVHPQELSQE